MSSAAYSEGICYGCGNTVWEGEDYLYVNPFTGDQYLNQPQWDYTEIMHSNCAEKLEIEDE